MKNNIILFKLIREQKWDEFTSFLTSHDIDNNKIDVNIRDNSGNYLINYSIIVNNIPVTTLLIKHGAKLDMIDSSGNTVLHIPIKFNYINMIKLLLKHDDQNIGVSLLDLKDIHGNNALHDAIPTKNKEIINILLKNSANTNTKTAKGTPPLHLAVYTKSHSTCKLLLEHSAITTDSTNSIGETALHLSTNLQLTKITKLLLEHNSNPNIQNYTNEYTPLHNAISINDKHTTKLLLNHGANPNTQDFYGNDAIHIALKKSNYEIAKYIVTQYHNTINLNQHNIDFNTPLHILLAKDDSVYKDYIKYFITPTILNIQNNNGNTALHYLTKKNLWQDHQLLLAHKKMNIFTKNNNNIRPIDYTTDSNIKQYIDLIAESYLNVLKDNKNIWKEKWENICKKVMFNDKLTPTEYKILSIKIKPNNTNTTDKEICLNITKKKLINMIINNNNNNTSYPTKLNKKCINVSQQQCTTNSTSCTFTGTTLDVLSGLIYLLKKHPKTCSPFSTGFATNREMCNYYKKIGIITKTSCEFLNFSIVWINKTIFIADDFDTQFNKCKNQQNNTTRFIIIPLGIELDHAAHANYLIYDIINNEIERFEPYGSQPPHNFDYKPKLLDNALRKVFSSAKYIEPQHYMTKIGFQYFDTLEFKQRLPTDPEGFCALWSVWYTDMRLSYHDVNRKSLIRKMTKSIREQKLSFKKLIRNYSTNITQVRDNLLTQANISLNDWINSKYTEEQLVKLFNYIIKSNNR